MEVPPFLSNLHSLGSRGEFAHPKPNICLWDSPFGVKDVVGHEAGVFLPQEPLILIIRCKLQVMICDISKENIPITAINTGGDFKLW